MTRQDCAVTALVDPTRIWTGDGRRFHLSSADLKRANPDRPTLEQVRTEIERGRLKEGIHFLRLPSGKPVFAGIALNVGLGPWPSRGRR
jgi:hypothetical protein